MTQPTRPGDPPASTRSPSTLAGPDPDAHVIDLATPDWCWSRLLGTTVGVLSSRGARGPLSLPVTYTVDDGRVLIPIESFSETAHLFAGRVLSLGLAGHAQDGLCWVVRATGVAHLSLLAHGTLVACRSSHPAHGGAPHGSDALLLAVDRLRGYFETPLHPVEAR